MPGPLTRYQVEVVTLARCKGAMAAAAAAGVGMDTGPADPLAPNADLNDPNATALDELAMPPADRSLVTDGDLLSIPPSLQAQLLDLIELRTLDTAYSRLILAPQSVQWEDFRSDRGTGGADAVLKYVEAKRQRYLAFWAQAAAPAVARLEPRNRHVLDPSGHYGPFRGP